jgi:PAS domain S-box-containing protein
MKIDGANRQYAFLAGGGKLGELIAAFDWSTTPLGPIANWSPTLKTSVALALRSPVPIVMLWGEDGTMIYNDAYAVFAGGRHPQLLGSKVREGWPEVADFNDNIMRVVMAGKTLSYREQELTLYRHGVAEKLWTDLDYSPILDEDGRPVAVIAIVIETTDRVMAQRSIAGEWQRMAQMFEQAPGFMAMLSGPAHRFELTNRAYLQLIGHRAVVGKTIREALPDIEGQGFYELLDKVYTTGEPFIGSSVKVLLQRTPGAESEERFVDLIYQPVRDAEGQVTGIFVEGSDVTERVAAERVRRESEAQFRLFAEAMPNHVWTSRPDGMLDWFNTRVYEYSGAAPGELDGQQWAMIVHPDDIAAAGAIWAERLASGEPYETEFRLRRHDGTYHWHIARAVPIRDADGSIARWIGTNTDIDEQKQAQSRQELLTHELEHRIKNILAMVAAISSQTLKNTDLDTARDSFNERLRALAGAHDILTKTRWTEASLAEVVQSAMAPCDAQKIVISGPFVAISPKMALSLALAVNELATNSLKYGALSVEQGRVHIEWSISAANADQPPDLNWTWMERNGPPVSPPTRRGFGTFLIQRVLAADFDGAVRIEYSPEGVECSLVAPMTSRAASV